jgi:ABC-2 type transport system permease protein
MWTLVRAETRKLATIRTVFVLMGLAVALPLLGVTVAWTAGAGAGFDLATAGGQRLLLSFTDAPVLAVLLGVLIGASEHRHGTIIQTLLAVPRRWRVLTAKAVVAVAASVVLTGLVAAATLGAGLPAIAAHGSELLLGPGELARTAALRGLVATAFGLAGLGVGEAVRSQAVALVAVLALTFVVGSVVAGAAPAVGWWLPLPDTLGTALVQAPPAAPFGRLAATGILAGYTAAALGAGAAVLTRRDLA